jgi:VCBS repeat protein/K319-like protein/FG-GAP repeat protein
MKRLCCLILVLSASAMVELGTSTLRAQPVSSPVFNLRRVAISQNVWPGDFNGDGFTDLAGSEKPPDRGGTGRVIVLLGNGTGNFTATSVTSYVGRVLGVGDFNGDGRTDLIVAGADSDANVAILPGTGNATFGPPRVVVSATEVTFALSADLDGDGKRDLVVGAEGYSVAVFPGNGDFTFGPEVTLATNASPHDGIVTDLNGDGRKDLVIANHYSHSVTVLLNQGALMFSGADVVLGGNANDVTAADVNGDGKPDLIVATSNGGDGDYYFEEGHAEVLLGHGDGTFGPGVTYEVPRGAWQVVVGDFTRDGILDIATANRSSIAFDDCSQWRKTWDSLSILPGRSNGTFGPASSFSLGNQSDPDDDDFKNQVRTLNTSDLNRDGATDLIVSWGAILMNVQADPNRPPMVDAGPDQQLPAPYQIVLQARAADDDQDMLTWTWTDQTGAVIARWPNVCTSNLNDGANVFTVTVDDGHGHQTSDTMTVTVGSNPGGTGSTSLSIAAPAEGSTIASGSPDTIAFHIEDSAQAIYHWSIDYSLDSGATWKHIWECHLAGRSSGPGVPDSRDETCTWQNPGPASTEALLVVRGQDDSDATIAQSAPVRLTIAPQPGGIPYPWRHQDLGAVGKAGSAAFSSGVFTVNGAGADIWGTADAFHFLYGRTDNIDSASVGEAWEVSARVDSVQNVNPWTKAGVMVRAGLSANSPHASLIVSPGKGIAFQRRLTAGGVSVSTAGPALTAPVWLRLTMQTSNSQEIVRAYYRKNVTDPWVLIGQDTFPAPMSQPQLGVAVSSHSAATTATAGFSNVEAAALAADWNGANIGSAGGSASTDGTLFSVTGGGADIWSTSDQFYYLYQEWSGDGTIVARVRSLENASAWSKAGVMFRESIAANAKQVDMIVSPSKGVAAQYRAGTGGVTQSAGAGAGAAAGWVRLTRAGDTFTAAWSKDGATWATIGSTTVAMSPAILIGLAVTSHNPSATAAASFDDVRVRQP